MNYNRIHDLKQLVSYHEGQARQAKAKMEESLLAAERVKQDMQIACYHPAIREEMKDDHKHTICMVCDKVLSREYVEPDIL